MGSVYHERDTVQLHVIAVKDKVIFRGTVLVRKSLGGDSQCYEYSTDHIARDFTEAEKKCKNS